jgi:hypothetical protein
MTRFVGLLAIAALAACSSSTGPRNLSFSARSTVSQTSPITVETVVTVTNTGNRTTQIEISTCPRAVEAYTTPERSGTPAWRAYGGQACDAAARLLSLGPGDYYDYHFTRSVDAALPAGTYFLAVEMGYARVPAGQFQK